MTFPSTLPATLPGDIELRVSAQPVPYRAALEEMTERNAQIAAGEARELIWLLEHPPVYTAGTSADLTELLDPRFEVVEAGRGGRYTYHGPGQRVAYVLLDLRKRARDARGFVHGLEGWVIETLKDFGVESFRSEGRIGVRIRKWVTMHGFAVNIRPDLAHFTGIVPCGIEEFGVTSLSRLGKEVEFATWDEALIARAPAFLAALDRPCPPETPA
jgi:lipoyl(octanoyl) transferase